MMSGFLGFFKYQTALVPRLDVRTAFDVAKHCVVSSMLTWALREEEIMGVRGAACLEHCETEFRYSRCIGASSVAEGCQIRSSSVEKVAREKGGQIHISES